MNNIKLAKRKVAYYNGQTENLNMKNETWKI